ncbi:CPCC family cysteine-rich protein [Glycomyces sp. NPDC047010]|uniref:CPCC family cysteine-rich protein n=1 Tax=Glycomyces sp. NPDC047010 TaxID=3155023 RepID=UPI0033FE296A
MEPLSTPRYPCPCCGFIVHEATGAHEVCPICGWQDDPVQLRWPEYRGGANKPSLIEAQRNFREIGASTERRRGRVRPPRPDEAKDPGFRPVDPAIDRFPSQDEEITEWPKDLTSLYWWRPGFGGR